MQLPRLPSPEMGATVLLSLLVAASPTSAMLNCEKLVIDKVKFNLGALGGPHSVHTTQYERPNHLNNTYTLDICHPLKIQSDIPKDEQCPNGTRVCGIKRIVKGDTNVVEKTIPIAYAQHGQPLEWSATRLKDSESNTDKEKEGIRLSLGAPKYGKYQQKTIIEFICDPDTEGTDGKEEEQEDEEEAARLREKREDDDEKDGDDKDDGDDGGDGEDETGPEKQVSADGTAIQFVSYGFERNSGWEGEVLRLEWRTSHACEKRGDDGGSEDQSSHWGWFTWIFIIAFLAISAYLIFGSWLNYTRYGARGWDLVPHGDFIRDVPYLMKDFTRSVLNTVQASGTRGGYSAV